MALDSVELKKKLGRLNKADQGSINPAKLMAALLGINEGSDSLVDMQNTEVVFDKDAKKITIPPTMTKLEASEELIKQYENEEKVIDVAADFEGWNWRDVLVAVKKVSEATFGWINGQNIYSFFGVQRPAEIDVTIDIQNGKPITEKCFYGRFEAAAWDAALITVGVNGGEVNITTNCKKKFSKAVSTYYDSIRQHLLNNSIYKGKTIVVTGGTDPNGSTAIDFEIIENKGNPNIILNEEEELVVDKFIIDSLEEKGKKCYLFTGDYGTGKTETAMRIGKEATKLDITFFYCKKAEVFDEFLNVCKKYQPCLVFLEDVDEIGAGEQRDSKMNSILNTLDGVQTKGNDITVIFTTNHEDRINPALRRPGRIDNIVKFNYPTDVTKDKIYKNELKHLKGAASLDYKRIVESTPPVQGAVIVEICSRTKKLAKRAGCVTTEDVLAAITSMKYQIDFMKGKVEQVDKNELALSIISEKVAKTMIDTNELKALLVGIATLRNRLSC